MSDPNETVAEVAGNDIEKGMNTILPGKDPLQGLHAEHEGGLEYTVLSIRDGAPSIHWVTLGETPKCSCNDYQGNRKSSFDGELGSEREPCAHIVKAVLADTMAPEELAVRELVNVTATVSNASREAKQAAEEARSTARELDNGLVSVRDAQAGAASNEGTSSSSSDTAEDTSGGSHSNDDNASAAAEKLQSAFDEVIDGMQVEYNEGMVWVNKTPKAPDTLPGPGNVEVFSVFLQEPSQVQYVHDDHDYKGAEPGSYFKNMLDPSDVDDYINEVLQ